MKLRRTADSFTRNQRHDVGVRPLTPAKQLNLLQSKLTEWKELLRANAPKARQMLRKLIDGWIVFNPDTSIERSRAFRSISGSRVRSLPSIAKLNHN